MPWTVCWRMPKVDLELNFKINELTDRERDLNQTCDTRLRVMVFWRVRSPTRGTEFQFTQTCGGNQRSQHERHSKCE